MSERERAPRIEVERPRCPFCHEDVGADDPKTACEACMAWHHRACWTEHGRCSGCGAGQAAGATPVVALARPRPRALPSGPPGEVDRRGAWFLFAVGASNVLLFGGLCAWDLLRGGQEMLGLALMFVPLGLWLSIWSGRMLWRRPGSSARSAKGA